MNYNILLRIMNIEFVFRVRPRLPSIFAKIKRAKNFYGYQAEFEQNKE